MLNQFRTLRPEYDWDRIQFCPRAQGVARAGLFPAGLADCKSHRRGQVLIEQDSLALLLRLRLRKSLGGR
jgi:hypothetical protein